MLTKRLLTLLPLVPLLACDPGPTGQPPPVSAVLVAGPEGLVWAGDALELVAVTMDAQGYALPGRLIEWTSEDPDVAEVSAAGVLEAKAAGTAVIVATSEGKRGEVAVTVYEADLLYEGYPAGLSEMMVLSLRGGEPERVLPAYTVVGRPVASPDGSRIAYVIADYIDSVGDIWVVDRDGSNATQITFDSELDDQPAWSPDGTKIAFRSYRTQRAGDIWVMDADGSNPVLLTPDPLPAVTDESHPAWSPDGSRIAYVSTAGGGLDIWTMRADGGDKVRLTLDGAFDTEPSWSPDGQWIVFRRGHVSQGSDLMIVPAAGGTPVALPVPGIEIEPAWSPDGRLIAFTVLQASGGSPQIYTMRPDGSDVTLRTTEYFWNGGRGPGWLRKP